MNVEVTCDCLPNTCVCTSLAPGTLLPLAFPIIFGILAPSSSSFAAYFPNYPFAALGIVCSYLISCALIYIYARFFGKKK